MTQRKRPYVICHMVPSVDGRIVTEPWGLSRTIHAEYERTAQAFEADAWMIGRVSMAPYVGKRRAPKTKAPSPIPRTDFIAQRRAAGFAIAIDPSGKLPWTSGAIDGEHVVAVLTEAVSDSYLAHLQSKGVSYVFGGKSRIDVRRVLETLRREFGIKKLLLEGGGKINGSFLEADVIDELSILVAPIADGSVGTPSLFDNPSAKRLPRRLRLVSHESRRGGLVWLRYKVKR